MNINKQHILQSEKGIALVIVLILSVISLAIVSALLFMITEETIMSGAHRFFRTAEEAGVGGTEIVGELIENRGTLSADIQTNLSPVITADNCFSEKINLSKTDWTAECSPPEMSLSIDASNALTFDMNFDLGNFRVFTKIVDTAEGNSDTGGLVTSGELGGEGVVASNTGLMNPPHTPYLYRIEVQAEDSTNPRERSRLSAEYAY